MKTKILKSILALLLTFMALPMMGQDWVEIHFKDGTLCRFVLDEVTGIYTSKTDAEGRHYNDYLFQYVTTIDGEFVYDIDEIENIEFLKSEPYISVYYWNRDTYYPIENDDWEMSEPTEMEQQIMQLTSDEDEAPYVSYTKEDSLYYDALAQEVINQFAVEESEDVNDVPRKRASQSDDDLAQEAIRNNGMNIFSGFEIEQLDWNSGLWGKTRYDNDAFQTFYNTDIKEGKKYLLVVFYHKGGFPNKKTAYIKLGQVNSGPIVDKISVRPGQEYVFLKVCLDNYLQGYGCVNFFPLVITEDSKARNYLNPIMVKHAPIIAENWRKQYYNYEFGTINGVPVYFNNDEEKGNTNIGDGYRQCVELCKRYVKELNSNINRKLSDSWGHAWNWPYNRQNDTKDPGKYIVFPNDGSRQVREGDLIVWQYKQWVYNKEKGKNELVDRGHIGVVIKTTENSISIAQQNAGTGKYTLPIGTKMKVVDRVVYDIHPETSVGAVYARTDPPKDPTYFIRFNHDAESVSSYSATMKASTTNLQFNVEKGKSRIKRFKITNSGYSTLTISSIKLAKGDAFSIDATKCTIEHGESKVVSVTFNPSRSGEYKDRILIESDADDNPKWYIQLSGVCEGTEDLALSAETASLVVGESTTIEITDGNGDYGVTNLNSSIAKATRNGNTITIDAVSVGNAKIVVTDIKTGQKIIIDVTVLAKLSLAIIGNIDLEVGASSNVKIVSGNNDYTPKSSNPTIATASIVGENITVQALSAGTATIIVTDNKTGQKASFTVTVTDPTPTDIPAEAIDLGLPSGTLWASYNIGATKPEEYGDYFSWGETEVRDKYYFTTYSLCDGTVTSCHDIGENISGTKYDVAHVKWGNGWCMPTKDDFRELVYNCDYKETTLNGVKGFQFTGSNGKYIFLPYTGYCWDTENSKAGTEGSYWSATQTTSVNKAHEMSFRNDRMLWDCYINRFAGLTVRPVKR